MYRAATSASSHPRVTGSRNRSTAPGRSNDWTRMDASSRLARAAGEHDWTKEKMTAKGSIGLESKYMQVGLIGWRGMVGSVLVQRMREERDFDLIDPVFFSTSQAGAPAPAIGKPAPAVKDATDLATLMN